MELLTTSLFVGIALTIGSFAYIRYRTFKDKNKKDWLLYPFRPAVIEKEAQDLIYLINKERMSRPNNLNMLLADQRACTLAVRRCNEMIEEQELSHTKWVDEHSELVQLGATSVGENIAYGYSSLKGVMESWKNSTGHRHNMLNTKWDYIGVSIVKDIRGRFWYCTLFLSE